MNRNQQKDTEQEFKLIESILWTSKDGYFLLDSHMERLASSANHFGFKYDGRKISDELDEAAQELEQDKRYKIRMLLATDGGIDITYEQISSAVPGTVPQIIVSTEHVNSNNDFLYHKTTLRDFYNRNFERYQTLGYYDVIFENESGELTEGSWNNLVIKQENKLLTPPVRCGLLNGVYRRHLINESELTEKVLTLEDLSSAQAVYCCNSVRKIVEVRFVENKNSHAEE